MAARSSIGRGGSGVHRAGPRLPDKRDATVRQIVAAWRRLTGGGRDRTTDRSTLVACSGGADSSALALALATTGSRIAVAHVVHDLRSPEETLGDRDAAARLAAALGVPFASLDVGVSRGAGNVERRAREQRYQALERLARLQACRFVATGHHADDQLETVLMRLLRGAGPRGLAGIHERRALADATVIRPMLAVTRARAEALCASSGWTWVEDATNADRTLRRNRLRGEVLPVLRAIEPDAARRAVRAARACAGAAGVVRDRAAEIEARVVERDGARVVARALLADAAPTVREAFLRAQHATLRGDAGRDRLGQASLDRVIRAIGDDTGGQRRFQLAGMLVVLERDHVRFMGRGTDG